MRCDDGEGWTVTCLHCLFTRHHPFSGPSRHPWHLYCPGSIRLAFQKKEKVNCFCFEMGVGGLRVHEDWSAWEGSLQNEEPLLPVPTPTLGVLVPKYHWLRPPLNDAGAVSTSLAAIAKTLDESLDLGQETHLPKYQQQGYLPRSLYLFFLVWIQNKK